MSDIKISIIVPTYNMGHLISRCIKSLTNQTLKDIEIIIVDDASTDNTEEIVKIFAKKDYRIKYIKHKENKRRGGARNTGLNYATGEYIGWVDADDWVSFDMFEKMYKKAKQYDCDIVQVNYFTVTTDGIKKPIIYFTEDIIHENETIFESTILKTKKGLFAGLCNKIYKRSLFENNKIRFPITYHEDGPVNMRLAFYAKKMYSLKEPLYYYLQHNNNTSDEVTYKSIEEIFIATKTMYDFLIEKKLFEKYKVDFLNDTFFRRVILTKLAGILNLYREKDKKDYIRYQIKYLQSHPKIYKELINNITTEKRKLLTEMSKDNIDLDKIVFYYEFCAGGYKRVIKNKIKSSSLFILYKKLKKKFNQKKRFKIPDNFILNSFKTQDKYVLLGFDDGPFMNDGLYDIMDTLDKYNAKAIFFLNGCDINDKYTNGRQKAIDIIKRGFILGSHLYRHIYYEHIQDIFFEDLKRQDKLIQDIYQECGLDINIADIPMRMPYLNYFPGLEDICFNMGHKYLIHGQPTGDWLSNKTVNEHVDSAIRILKKGQIYVLHNRSFTYKWLDIFLAELEDRKYKTIQKINLE